MAPLLLAIQFLTLFPISVKQAKPRDLAYSLIYYPLVGALIGGILAGVCGITTLLQWSAFASSALLVVTLIVLTGGLHLDGLADSADAFLSQKDKEKKLKIMRDSHIGTMGVLSLVSIIILKIALLAMLPGSLRGFSVVLMCITSRWIMVFLIYAFPYARPEGKGKVFKDGINNKIFILSSLSALVLIFLLWQIKGIILFVLIALSAYLFGIFARRQCGGITGDILGAGNELAETLVLLLICLSERGLLCLL
ncbi:MAG: adenosylcobinamide-GDP ribazoletransferase [Candidatus Omnitrophica bacterium]|nr:adenosylcobinamide-GDP ribazoletransferase [Candidatus Omnitrophota bacterium]